MRQLMYIGNGAVEFQEVREHVDVPRGHALVRPLAVARCDIDLPMVRHDLFPGPFPLGHESVAEIVAIGDGVERLSIGDRVLVPFQLSCGACTACRQSHFAACPVHRGPAGAMFGFGLSGGGHGGALAEQLLVPSADHLLIPAPSAVSSVALATLSDNVVDAYRSVGPPLSRSPGSPVSVFGGSLPSIGLYAVQMAIALGSQEVRYYDADVARCGIAEYLGAGVEEVPSGKWPRRFPSAPITVDASGDPEGLACALRSTASYGHCTVASIYFTDPVMPLLEMYTRGVTVHTSRADSRLFLPEVVNLVEARTFDPLTVPVLEVPWTDAEAGWLEPAVKVVIAL